jgi:hypothetical protein
VFVTESVLPPVNFSLRHFHLGEGFQRCVQIGSSGYGFLHSFNDFLDASRIEFELAYFDDSELQIIVDNVEPVKSEIGAFLAQAGDGVCGLIEILEPLCDAFGPHGLFSELQDLVVGEGPVERDEARHRLGCLECEDSEGRRVRFLVVREKIVQGDALGGPREPGHGCNHHARRVSVGFYGEEYWRRETLVFEGAVGMGDDPSKLVHADAFIRLGPKKKYIYILQSTKSVSDKRMMADYDWGCTAT